jgi:hypothetical protein
MACTVAGEQFWPPGDSPINPTIASYSHQNLNTSVNKKNKAKGTYLSKINQELGMQSSNNRIKKI